jgi:cytochrome P450
MGHHHLQAKALLKYVQFTMPMPILHDIAAFVIRTVKAQNATVFHQLATRKVQERLLSEDQTTTTTTTDQPNPDILSHFLRSRTKYPSLMTPEQITRHCMVNIVAGTGTSTSAIVNVLRYLVANPPAQARLYHELQQTATTATTTTLPRWRDIQPLPFLEGLIREGIRLRFSDSFNPLARVVGASGMALPCGTRLPAGTLVGIKPSVASMQEKTFGPRPADFWPERWCREEGEGEEEYRERRGRMDRGDMSFGSGTRGCIGRGIALMQVYKVVAAVVARYEVSVVISFGCDVVVCLMTLTGLF